MKPKILIMAFEVGDEKEEEFLAELFSGEVLRAIPSALIGHRDGMTLQDLKEEIERIKTICQT